MNEDYLRALIENIKDDNSIQTETIKEKLKKLAKTSFDKGREYEIETIFRWIRKNYDIIIDNKCTCCDNNKMKYHRLIRYLKKLKEKK